MASRLNATDLQRMAEDLPDDIGDNTDARSRLLRIVEILKMHTDESRGLTAKQIGEILRYKSKSGAAPSEPTILKDLNILASSHIPDLQILKPTRGKNDGFKYIHSAISSEEARLLINVVKSCKFITQEQSDELCDHLGRLISKHQRDIIAKNVYIEEHRKSQSPNVFETVDIASKAIARGLQISFNYCYYDLDGKEKFLKNESNNRFTETPIGIIYSFNNYYLETWSDIPHNGKHILTRRIERMRNAEISFLEARENDYISKHKGEMGTHLAEKFDMMSGDSCEIFLEVDSLSSNLIFNRFGSDHCLEHILTKKDGSGVGYLRLTVQLSDTFYRWLFGVSDGIKIVKPGNDMWIREKSWNKLPTANRTREELLSDYKRAVEGYRNSLKKACEIYEPKENQG